MSDGSSGRLIILSGPSGAGKSTVVRHLLKECDLPLKLSVSATTRSPREGEKHGQHYFFLSDEEFQQRRDAGGFLECKEVFGLGYWYGTLREQVTTGLNAGDWVILEIDVQGALALMDDKSLSPISLFIHPGGMKELEHRLRSRGTETEQAIRARLETAHNEMQQMHRYQFEVINGSVDLAVVEICQILKDQKENYPCSKS
ncbi:MAG: guanylate kinase [Rhodopirellula sp.]|nr:guanylate kinase [Rhodopirellula sp.]OUX50260.1 MAG: guanylate kinase [Rhodopirellula sp. TMED283]